MATKTEKMPMATCLWFDKNAEEAAEFYASLFPHSRVTSVNTISGSVRVANGGRIGSAKSVSGSVEILDTQIDGALEAQSVSGSVTLRKVNARRVNVGSISGTVQVEDLQFRDEGLVVLVRRGKTDPEGAGRK